MKIYIGCDHAGFYLKKHIIEFLKQNTYEFQNVFCLDGRMCDYPDAAKSVCGKVSIEKDTIGILICGTGIGISIAVNRYKNVRAALCSSTMCAEMSRKHNDSNV